MLPILQNGNGRHVSWPSVLIAFFGLLSMIVNAYVVLETAKNSHRIVTVQETVTAVEGKVDNVEELATETVIMGNHNTTVMRQQAVDTARQLLQLQPGDQSAIDRLKRAEEALALQVTLQAEANAAARRVADRSTGDKNLPDRVVTEEEGSEDGR